jgi:hypothetical protein
MVLESELSSVVNCGSRTVSAHSTLEPLPCQRPWWTGSKQSGVDPVPDPNMFLPLPCQRPWWTGSKQSGVDPVPDPNITLPLPCQRPWWPAIQLYSELILAWHGISNQSVPTCHSCKDFQLSLISRRNERQVNHAHCDLSVATSDKWPYSILLKMEGVQACEKCGW